MKTCKECIHYNWRPMMMPFVNCEVANRKVFSSDKACDLFEAAKCLTCGYGEEAIKLDNGFVLKCRLASNESGLGVELYVMHDSFCDFWKAR